MSTLAEKSLTVTRPILFHYFQDTEQYRAMAQSVFEAFGAGTLKAAPPTAFRLEHAREAHDFLDSRAATSGFVLRP